MRRLSARFALFVVITAALLECQTATDAERIIAVALKPSSVETNLRRLTDEVGGRVTGTPAIERGVAWGLAAFRAAGGENVHSEEFQVPHSWAEGATSMTVVAPEQFRVHAVSLGWAPALAPHH